MTAICIQYFFWIFSSIFVCLRVSLIIFTGPAVVLPVLRRINCKERYIIFCIGKACLTILSEYLSLFFCFELIVESSFTIALSQFFLQIATGTVVGISMGFATVWLLKRNWVPADLAKSFILGIALLSFGVSDFILHESGLLATIITGFVSWH